LLLDLRGSLAKQQAADPVLMCIALNNLGQLRYMQKRYGESVELYLDSVRIGQATLGEQHPTLATLLSNLGMSPKAGRRSPHLRRNFQQLFGGAAETWAQARSQPAGAAVSADCSSFQAS